MNMFNLDAIFVTKEFKVFIILKMEKNTMNNVMMILCCQNATSVLNPLKTHILLINGIINIINHTFKLPSVIHVIELFARLTKGGTKIDSEKYLQLMQTISNK